MQCFDGKRIFCFAIRLLALFFFLLLPDFGRAEDSARIIIGDHPDIEVAMRVKAIDEATKSIKLVTFNFDGNSRYGKSIFEALKRAANRGVEIKIMFNSLSTSFLGGSFKDSIRYLESKECVGVNCGNLSGRLKAGLSPDDFLHEKFLIIDGGHENAKIFSGGLNYDKFSADFYDDGFLILPGEAGDKDALHKRINDFFEQTWETVNRGSPPKQINKTKQNSSNGFNENSNTKNLSRPEVRFPCESPIVRDAKAHRQSYLCDSSFQ